MSMKKSDMAKSLAKKVAGKLKSTGTPQRFGGGSAIAAAKPEKSPAAAQTKAVPVSFRLPADLARRLRERAVAHPGGMGGAVAEAVEQWLAADDAAPAQRAKARASGGGASP